MRTSAKYIKKNNLSCEQPPIVHITCRLIEQYALCISQTIEDFSITLLPEDPNTAVILMSSDACNFLQ